MLISGSLLDCRDTKCDLKWIFFKYNCRPLENLNITMVPPWRGGSFDDLGSKFGEELMIGDFFCVELSCRVRHSRHKMCSQRNPSLNTIAVHYRIWIHQMHRLYTALLLIIVFWKEDSNSWKYSCLMVEFSCPVWWLRHKKVVPNKSWFSLLCVEHKLWIN